MINHKQKMKLLENWGDRADSMSCLAEVRLFDPMSSWECYIYAMNPDDEEEILCLVKYSKCDPAITHLTSMKWLRALFNQHGESVRVDEEYRPRRTAELFKRLNEGLE